jgi:hypothetical protein
MRNSRLLLCLAILLAAPFVSLAQAAAAPEQHAPKELPRIVHWGFDLLRRDAFEEAERQIFAGSRVPTNGILSGGFRSFREQDGQYQGFQVISAQDVTRRLRIYYLALEYEHAPHFLKLVVYLTPDGWVILRAPVWVSDENAFDTLTAGRD